MGFEVTFRDLWSDSVRGLETGTIDSVITSFFCACAREAGYGDLPFISVDLQLAGCCGCVWISRYYHLPFPIRKTYSGGSKYCSLRSQHHDPHRTDGLQSIH